MEGLALSSTVAGFLTAVFAKDQVDVAISIGLLTTAFILNLCAEGNE